MRSATSHVPRQEQQTIDRPNDQATDQLVADVLKEIAKTLWPDNTAANLAARIIAPRGKHPTVRTIERYFEGSRDWSGDAIAAIVTEILKRHSLRNVKIVARR